MRRCGRGGLPKLGYDETIRILRKGRNQLWRKSVAVLDVVTPRARHWLINILSQSMSRKASVSISWMLGATGIEPVAAR
jgi:hypothetical protein